MMSNVSIGYQDLEFEGRLYDEEDYAEQMKQSFAELTSITYQYVGKSEKTIASKKYLVSKYTIDNGTMYQEVYLRKIGDNVMMLMTVSYLSGKESIANEFIESIREP